jgi:hypothetical protein
MLKPAAERAVMTESQFVPAAWSTQQALASASYLARSADCLHPVKAYVNKMQMKNLSNIISAEFLPRRSYFQ